MPLNAEDKNLLKSIYQNIEEVPLKPGDPRYQPIYEAGGGDDPVEVLLGNIELSAIESMQLFSGFRGSGKTTELLRLKEKLEQLGYFVFYADALEYLSPAEPIDITELLIVIAGSFGDAVEQELDVKIVTESYWDRFWHYLNKTNVEITEVGLKTGAEFKMALKSSPSFRQRLQSILANRISDLKKQLDSFVAECLVAIRKAKGPETKVVFLFDSLEQLRGSISNEQAVTRSVERLFAQNDKELKLPYIHCVYTVPPWLQFAAPNLKNILILPSIRQWENDDARTVYEPGWEGLRNLLMKRCQIGDTDGFHKLFGPSDKNGANRLADQLIAVCGGHFRDALRLLREVLVRVRSAESFPVSAVVLQKAMSAFRSNFFPISIQDAIWLDKIGSSRDCSLPSNEYEDVQRLTRLLDTHFVLYLKNGESWYDTHPLIRDEVAAIVKRQEELTAASETSTPS